VAGTFRQSSSRMIAWTVQGGQVCDLIFGLLETSSTGLQLRYHTLLVFWLLSFEDEIAKQLNR
jgi:hypothetical protein